VSVHRSSRGISRGGRYVHEEPAQAGTVALAGVPALGLLNRGLVRLLGLPGRLFCDGLTNQLEPSAVDGELGEELALAGTTKPPPA